MEHAAPSRVMSRPATTGLVPLLRAAQGVLVLAMVAMAVIGALFLVPGSFVQTAFLEAVPAPAPSPTTMGLACFASVLTAAAWFWVLRMLVRVVRTVQQGDPFVEANIGRLRAMWIVIAATEVFRMIVHSAADIALSGTAVQPADTGLDIRIGTWFLVLVIAAISEAFRQGAEMRREQELTI